MIVSLLIYLFSPEFELIIEVLGAKFLKLFLLCQHISKRILASMLALVDF